MKLSLEGLRNKEEWIKAGFILPKFDIEKMRKATEEGCTWIHFGAGNIFRCFPAARMQALIEKGLSDTGIIVAESFDFEIVDKICEETPVTDSNGTVAEGKKPVINTITIEE